ncbi:hypothetical protein [Amycolatopsis nigrescens]|uniref:hypothetical protein n=1 Tax=Amycolatopsis nigrescens TaxID=381445 RepID=UPI000477BA7B|nr:hypothetical protein [Amycolatopsis nigrescens]
MKSRIARSIAVVAIGGLLAVASGGVAAAGTLGGKGTSSTQAAGAQMLQFRDELTKVAYAGDVTSTRSALGKMNPLLKDLSEGKRYSIAVEQQNVATDAKARSSEASRLLADPNAKPRQLPPLPLPPLPDLPGPLKVVSDLLKTLLTAVTGLVAGLLGGGLPVPPLPVPPVPPLPTP